VYGNNRHQPKNECESQQSEWQIPLEALGRTKNSEGRIKVRKMKVNTHGTVQLLKGDR
jgi:hypothetical protein